MQMYLEQITSRTVFESINGAAMRAGKTNFIVVF